MWLDVTITTVEFFLTDDKPYKFIAMDALMFADMGIITATHVQSFTRAC